MTDRSHELLVNAAIQCQQTAERLREWAENDNRMSERYRNEADRLTTVRDALLGVLEQEQGHGLKSTQTGGVS